LIGYWKYWMRKNTSLKLFSIYWAICIVIGFYRLIFLPISANNSLIYLVIASHPGIGWLIYLMCSITKDSYDEYKAKHKNL